ncbi:MAG: hypothetical protein M1376_24550 [Planctomycetes bacterium]|nr:hypothetical protein [Planctomycetota bacterium]
MMIGVAVLLALLVALVAISVRRRLQAKRQKADELDVAILRHGLTARERQILLAIAVRSGLRHTPDIFQQVDAFDRGAVQLLAECAQTRTPQEITALKAEVAVVRQKLGAQPVATGRGAVAPGRPSSREIPVGVPLELTGRRGDQAVTLRVEVLRNDAIELTVALRAPLGSKPGDSWLARYYSGLSAWEFRTSTARCDDQRLVLNHSTDIHFVNRRRYPRVSVRWPARVAPLPLIHNEPVAPHPDVSSGAVACAPAFVEGVVTEFGGPGLRIEAPLPVQVNDRVLVVFRLGGALGDTGAGPRTVTGIGHVKHRRQVGSALSIAIELTGLSDAEMETLVSLVRELFSLASDTDARRTATPQETPVYATAAS